MEKALEKPLIKSPKSPKLPKKPKIGKFNAVMIAITLISVGLIIYAIMSYINKPNTYEELLPLMDEAQAFDMKASELSGQYEDIEDQVGENVYFNTIEQGYEDSVVVHQRMIDEIAETNRKVQEAGGITTYDELQRVKVPASDKYVKKEVDEYFESMGYDVEAGQREGAVSTLDQTASSELGQ